MKVMVVHNRYESANPSGENLVFEDEIRALERRGLEVMALDDTSDRAFAGGLTSKVEAAAGAIYAPRGVARFREGLRRFAPDVVHIHNLFPFFSPQVIRIAKRAKIPVLQTVHNYRHSCIQGFHF